MNKQIDRHTRWIARQVDRYIIICYALECEGDSELKPLFPVDFRDRNWGQGMGGHLGFDSTLSEIKMVSGEVKGNLENGILLIYPHRFYKISPQAASTPTWASCCC